MTRIWHHLICCLILAWSFDARGYEILTHQQVLTRQAANQSVLQTDPRVLRGFGLEKSITDTTQKFPNSRAQDRTVRELLEDGSRFEDDVVPILGFTKHFYNPLTGLGLNVPSLPTQTASVVWALQGGQEFSYLRARQYLLDALTRQSESDRRRAFGLAFQKQR